MANRLKDATSPYLQQHAGNPVDWFPWGEEAFRKARQEDKPVFLSIGYSTCHWCHVMAHESFEDDEVAELLNRYFVSIKVDKEERPDIDSIYMSVCQAFTGSGGWPTSIFMTADQKPFFAGTYFPKHSVCGRPGMLDLLTAIHDLWESDRYALLQQAETMIDHLKDRPTANGWADPKLVQRGAEQLKQLYDRTNGGFGRAPKFPTPHNLLFLLDYGKQQQDKACVDMVEYTLLQMYRGGMFDHVGYGFCRYSTDARFLVPHFEKMLYDNALLILAYCKAYTVTKNKFYKEVAESVGEYILQEMTSPEGGFYSAQDADSDGVEGKFYVFTPDEVFSVLGKEKGELFNRHFDITAQGNFEGKSIPNLLNSHDVERVPKEWLLQLRDYRRKRCRLHLDDKILTSWNGLMIAAMCHLFAVTGDDRYLAAAKKADSFLCEHLTEGDTLYVSWRDSKRSGKGFLDDYGACIYAQLALYSATLERKHLERAERLCTIILRLFKDVDNGGFFLYGADNEQLILQPKETYDGAMPSGNSLMAWNFVRLWHVTGSEQWQKEAKAQLDFLAAGAKEYPAGQTMFLLALLQFETEPTRITAIPATPDDRKNLAVKTGMDAVVTVVEGGESYPMRNGQTTFYVCRSHACLPPVNDLKELEL